jgi:hypothetical protein
MSCGDPTLNANLSYYSKLVVTSPFPARVFHLREKQHTQTIADELRRRVEIRIRDVPDLFGVFKNWEDKKIRKIMAEMVEINLKEGECLFRD